MDRYEADEILNLAIMSKTAYFIVEGVDDVCIYEEIAKSAGVKCEVYAVEMIDGLSGGNDGVIEALEELAMLSMSPGKRVEHYVLGIVDRDARYYRNDMPTQAAVLCLNFYSLESHFVSKSVIRPSINRTTRTSINDDIDVDSLFNKVMDEIIDIYYFSLEALKNAVVPNYAALVGHKTKIGKRKDKNIVTHLGAIESDLDNFASSFGISPTFNSMREFVKGKWLLTVFAEALFVEIENLTINCKSKLISQCRMCELNNASPCLYRLRGGMNKNSLYSILQDFVEIPDFDYIKDAMVKVQATSVI